MSQLFKLISFFCITLIFLSSCSHNNSKKTIKIGLLPIPDALPFYTGAKKGYFKNKNLDVKFVNFQSAAERDAAYAGKSIDGLLSDLVVISIMKNKGIDIETVFAIQATSRENSSRAAILARPGLTNSEISKIKGLKLAVANNCIVDYVADKLMESKGIINYQKCSVPSIPLRLTMLLNNKIDSCIITDPYIEYAIKKGATLIAKDEQSLYHIILAVNSLTFSNQEILNLLKKGYDKSIRDLNDDPEGHIQDLVQLCGIQEDFVSNKSVPSFQEAVGVCEKKFPVVKDWLLTHKKISD